jgi:heme exporter protein D
LSPAQRASGALRTFNLRCAACLCFQALHVCLLVVVIVVAVPRCHVRLQQLQDQAQQQQRVMGMRQREEGCCGI